MAGYDGYSMSNNARAAYDDDRMPLSKWTKKAIIAFIDDNYDVADSQLASLNKMTKSELVSDFLSWTEWHHTSMFYNCTDFYAINNEAVEEFLASIDEDTRKSESMNRLHARVAQRKEAEAREEAKLAEEADRPHGLNEALAAGWAQKVSERVSKKGVKLLTVRYQEAGIVKEFEYNAEHDALCYVKLEKLEA